MSMPEPVDLAEWLERAQASSSPQREVVSQSVSEAGSSESVQSAGAEKLEIAPKRERPAEFDELIRPLEDLHPVWRLREPGLTWCLNEFHEDPDRFVLLVDYVIKAWNAGTSTKPLGLLCCLVLEDERCG